MRVRSLIGRSPAFWLTPLILILSWMHVQATLAFAAVPYALQATSAATSATFLIAAICGACAAWEGGRLHRAGWTQHPFGRSWLSVALHAMRIPLAIALVCVLGVLVVTFISQGLASDQASMSLALFPRSCRSPDTYRHDVTEYDRGYIEIPTTITVPVFHGWCLCGIF